MSRAWNESPQIIISVRPISFKTSLGTSEIKIAEQITTEPLEIAEELNLHFSTIGERLPSEIPVSDMEPEAMSTLYRTAFRVDLKNTSA